MADQGVRADVTERERSHRDRESAKNREILMASAWCNSPQRSALVMQPPKQHLVLGSILYRRFNNKFPSISLKRNFMMGNR